MVHKTNFYLFNPFACSIPYGPGHKELISATFKQQSRLAKVSILRESRGGGGGGQGVKTPSPGKT